MTGEIPAPAKAKGRDKDDKSSPKTIEALQNIRMYGDLAGTVETIPSVLLSLVVKVGKLADGELVVVPLTELQIYANPIGFEGEEVEEGEVVEGYSTVIPMENAAFLIEDLSRDFAAACEQLVHLVGNGPHLEPSRLAMGRSYLESVQQHVTDALASLAKLPDRH